MNVTEESGLLPENWERSETSTRIPYYINHNDGTTHWEHPIFTQVILEFDGLNSIKYGAYRAAMKLRATQKLTHLNEVNLHILKESFREFGLGPGSDRNLEVISVEELETLLVSLFQLVSRDREPHVQAEKCVELTLSFLLRCLDSGRTGAIKIRSLQIVLIALSNAPLEDKYEIMFSQVTQHNGIGISQTNLKILLHDLLMLTDSVVESNTFDQETLDDAVDNCWKLSNNHNTDTLNVKEFRNWMLREPMCVVWLPTLHRLAAAETIKHEAKCTKCKMFPIVGFRYRCLKCSNVDLCQNCFWTQKTLKNHKLTHPTREYCLATTTGDDIRDFMKQLKNKLTRRYRHRGPKVNYLKYSTTQRAPEERIPHQSPIFDNVHTRINLLASRLQELEGDTQPLQDSTQLLQDSTHPLQDSTQPPQDSTQPTLQDSTQPLQDSTVPSPPVHVLASPEPEPPSHPRHAREAESTHTHIPSPLRTISPIMPPPAIIRPDTHDLEAKLRLESHVIELRGKNKVEAERRRKLEKQVVTLEHSMMEDMEARRELEQRVHDLQESNSLYKERMAQLLATPPVTKTVRVPVPIQTPPSSVTEMRTQGVNTPYQASRDGWSYSMGSQTSSLLGGEEEDMDAILRDLLSAFPQQTKRSVASDKNTRIFKTVEKVGNSVTSLVGQIKHS